MKIILELEIKLNQNNFNSNVDYVDESIHGPFNDDEIETNYNKLVDECINRGYYDKVLSRSNNRTKLANGGSFTKYFIIKNI